MQVHKRFDEPQKHIVREEIFPVIPGSIVPTTDMDSQSTGTVGRLCQHRLTGFHHGRLEGKEVDDLRLVFQEQIIPTGFPAYNGDVLVFQHLLFLSLDVGPFLIKLQRRYQSPFGGIFGDGVTPEIMVRRIADMEILELIGKTHRHRFPSVLPSPGIEMSVL